MITYVSKENNLGAQLVRTNFLYPYQMLSFYEIKSFTRAQRNTDYEVSVPKCPGNGYISYTKDKYFRSITSIRAICFLWH